MAARYEGAMSPLFTCPLCRFSKDVPADNLPRQQATVICPSCRQRFTYTPPAPATEPPPIRTYPSPTVTRSATDARQASPARPGAEPSPARPRSTPSWATIDLKSLSPGQKSAVAAFMLVVLSLVGVRLWAAEKARAIPFPNMIAASVDRVAISWGKSILVFDPAGKQVASIPAPADAEIVHLAYDGEGNLWLGDYRTKRIFRLQGGHWVTVVDGAGTIGGTFKFVQYPPTGEIFVTDTTNHRILAYSATGRLLRTISRAGKGEGELMFPNEILLLDGDLLVVNTNAGRIDLFTRDGRFLKTFRQTEKDGFYRFPTLMTWLDGGRFAYLLTADLENAEAVVCDADGNTMGEFVTPKPLREVGDIACANGRAIITDNGTRQIYTFDAATLAYLGPFNQELSDRAASENRLESRYNLAGRGALFGLLVICIWAAIALYRTQRGTGRVATTAVTRLLADMATPTGGGEARQPAGATATMAGTGTRPSPVPPVGGSWKPALLSAIYPGLGQFYNRQILKGSVLAALFTLEAYIITGPIIQIIDHSAELPPLGIPLLVVIGLSPVVTWILAVYDARRTAHGERRRATL